MSTEQYTLDCTGDCVVGDVVTFEKAVFSGSYRKPIFTGHTQVTGKIIKESYGEKTGQHTFTVELLDGGKMRIKGRNLYRNGVRRKPWKSEADRRKALDEKHKRGDWAREAVYNRWGATP